LSVQAAYSLFIGLDEERGKVSLEKYQVYAHLRRTGYSVLRAPPPLLLPPSSPTLPPPASLWQWLLSLLTPSSSSSMVHSRQPPYGPLVRPGIYRSYAPIYSQLALIPRHIPTAHVVTSGPPQEPFRIYYHVWKSGGVFSKARPPIPNFRIAVVDARSTSVPTLEQMSSLVESMPWDPPEPRKEGAPMNIGLTYKRLKHGWHHAILAVVDRGLISYLRFTEMAFGEEKLFESFGGFKGPKGGKKGGRGGKSGRGRGRGGKRGG
jgi:tRNA-splicing endonuclease subunit Sen54